MARPKKDNADYFSHDADMRNDLKVKALRNRFGLDGYAIWNMLLEVLTDSTHFEYEWTEISKELMAADFGIETTKLDQIIEYATKLNLLTLNSETNIIYSQKLMDRFNGLLSKRQRERNVVIDDDNPTKTPLSTPINPQSKVKKSRVNKSKENNTKLDFAFIEDFMRLPFMDWIDYKKGKGKTYKTQKSLQACYTEMKNLSNNNPEIAAKIVNKSMANNWDGMFAIKSNDSFEKINEKGQRYYDNGIIIPKDAPQRPSARHYWNAELNKWGIS